MRNSTIIIVRLCLVGAIVRWHLFYGIVARAPYMDLPAGISTLLTFLP